VQVQVSRSKSLRPALHKAHLDLGLAYSRQSARHPGGFVRFDLYGKGTERPQSTGVSNVFLRPASRVTFRQRSCAQSRVEFCPKGRVVLFLHLLWCVLLRPTLVVKIKKRRNPLHHGKVMIVKLKKSKKNIQFKFTSCRFGPRGPTT
jgi:hypothetical protein